MSGDEDHDESDEMHWSQRNNLMVAQISSSHKTCDRDNNNKKRSHTQLDSRKQVIALQDRVITINIKEAQHPLK